MPRSRSSCGKTEKQKCNIQRQFSWTQTVVCGWNDTHRRDLSARVADASGPTAWHVWRACTGEDPCGIMLFIDIWSTMHSKFITERWNCSAQGTADRLPAELSVARGQKLTTFFSFRSSACASHRWTLPLPPRGVLLTVQSQRGPTLFLRHSSDSGIIPMAGLFRCRHYSEDRNLSKTGDHWSRNW